MNRHVVMPAAELPVQAAADVVVVGGSFAGIGAALAASRAGRTVVIAEPGTFLGHEITRTGRWWLSERALSGIDEQVRDVLLDGSGVQDDRGEIGLWPDGVKRGLEDVLMAAGVEILYGCHFLGEHVADGCRIVVVGTKAGRRVLRGDLVVRTTARAATTATWWHTLELTGVDGVSSPRIEVPGSIGLLGDTAYLHRGYLGAGHLLVEYGARVPVADAAWQLRRLGVDLLEHLVTSHAGFSRAWLAATGAESVPGEHPPVLDLGALLADGSRRLHHTSAVPTPSVDVTGSVREPSVTVSETQARRPGRPLSQQSVPEVTVEVLRRVEVLVVGAGTSGASAAAAAAGDGADTMVVEMNSGFGGSGTLGAVDSYWYGQRTGLVEDVRNRTDWLHKQLAQHATRSRWNITAKAHALQAMVSERGADVLTDGFAVAAVLRGKRVAGAVLCTPEGLRAVLADVVIDATGDADVVAFAGAATRYGAERTHSTMWCSLAQLVEPGRSRNNFGGIVDVADVADYTRAVLAARRRGGRLHDHGSYLAPRETRTVVGRVTLTLTDQLVSRHWPDVVNVHFSNHDIKGKSESIWTLQGLIPPNLEIEVPLRALLPEGLDGIVVVGKAISVTHDGLAAVRMQADQENLGGVVGLLAAHCVRAGTGPGAIEVAGFQDELVERGLLPARVRKEPAGARWQVPEHVTAEDLAGRLLTEVPLHRYSDVGMAAVHRSGIPFVELICRPGLPIDDQLVAALRSGDRAVRQVAAQVLTCRGRSAGVEALLQDLADLLAEEKLPPRSAQIRHVQLPPDQAAMPAPAYLLYTLGLAREPRAIELWTQVAEKVDASDEALRDPLLGTFAYVDAVCFGAERLGDPAAVPLLRILHGQPTLHRQDHESGLDNDVLDERKAMLELAIGRALARCGAVDGYDVLLAYLRDNRAQLARAAHSELVLLLGRDLGDDPAVWQSACAALDPVPMPLPDRYDLKAPDGVLSFDHVD